jgi:hypothetical protein
MSTTEPSVYNPPVDLPVDLPVYNPAALREVNGIRTFANDKLQSAIDEAVKALDGKIVAAVAHHIYRNDGTEIENITKVSVAVRIGDSWSIMAGAYKDWEHGDVGAEAKATFSR